MSDEISYAGLIKRLSVPPGWSAPVVLEEGRLRAEAITRRHLADDVRGINASLALIPKTRGGDWPTEPVTEDFNYVDLVWHECEFRENESFTYAVYADDRYIGCAYFYPVGRRTPLSAGLLRHDVDVSWWVTPDAYGAGLYDELYVALSDWATSRFPFRNPHFSNVEIPRIGGDG